MPSGKVRNVPTSVLGRGTEAEIHDILDQSVRFEGELRLTMKQQLHHQAWHCAMNVRAINAADTCADVTLLPESACKRAP